MNLFSIGNVNAYADTRIVIIWHAVRFALDIQGLMKRHLE